MLKVGDDVTLQKFNHQIIRYLTDIHIIVLYYNYAKFGH